MYHIIAKSAEERTAVSNKPREESERDAFECPICGGQVVMEHSLPTRVTGLGSIDFRCLGCEDWIDVELDRKHVHKPVCEFEEYALSVAREYFEERRAAR